MDMKEPQSSENFIAEQKMILAENPDCSNSQYNLGVVMMQQGKLEEAIVYFEDVLDSFPGTPAAPNALLHLYKCFTEIGWDDRAEEARDRLLERYPDSDAAREIVGGP